MSRKISVPNLRILKAIADLINLHEYSPSFREIGEKVGIYSTSTVSDHVSKLLEHGLITSLGTKPIQPRTIRVSDAGYRALDKNKNLAEGRIHYETK